MRIYFAGMPFLMVYNFGSAILRANGDTQRPLAYLTVAGVVNVLLNLFFVIVMGMDVAGVALATTLSQGVSAGLIVLCLTRLDNTCRLDIHRLRVDKNILKQLMRIGMPAGLQGCLFSLSNVLIQSAINSFGSLAMSGNTAAGNIEGFLAVSVNAMHQTALNFVGQNHGAHNYKRINRSMLYSTGLASVIGLVGGNLVVFFGNPLLGLYTDDPAVVSYGLIRVGIMCSTYLLGGMMDALCGAIRGLGYSVLPMVVSLAGVCGARILWLCTIFAWNPTLPTLYWSYPVTWGLTAAAHLACFLYVRKYKLKI
jgi:Na+-driven multidrug efflux pump